MDALTALSPRGTDDPLAALGLAPAAQTRRDELGQSEFLELMTTQLQSQDPLEPMENGAFIAQLAQFSTVSGMDRLVETVDALAQSLAGSSALEAGNLLDRSALVPVSSLDVGRVSSRVGAVDVPSNAFDVRIRALDASGSVLGTMGLGDLPAGLADFDFSPLAPSSGALRLVAEATVDGERSELPVLTTRRIDAVTLGRDGAETTFSADDGSSHALDDVRRLY